MNSVGGVFKDVKHTREWFNNHYNLIFSSFEAKHCYNCGVETDLHIHHIVPLSLGGTNNKSNLCLLCDKCHSKVHGINLANHKKLQRLGIEKAKAQGKHLGRPRVSLDTLTKQQRQLLDENYPRWKSGEITAVQFMHVLGIKKTTFYKIVKEYEAQAKTK